jgi:chaperonin GroES
VDVEAGDIVLFTQWAGSEIKMDGKEYLVLKESDVIGIIEETKSGKKAA